MTTVDDRIPVFVPICPLRERVPASASTANGWPGAPGFRAGTPRRSPKRARTAGSRSARSHHRRGGPALRCGQRLRRGPGPGDRCAPRRRHTSGPASRDSGASSRESRRRPRGETAFRTRAVHLIGEPGAFGRGAAGARHPRRLEHGRQLEVAPRQVERRGQDEVGSSAGHTGHAAGTRPPAPGPASPNRTVNAPPPLPGLPAPPKPAVPGHNEAEPPEPGIAGPVVRVPGGRGEFTAPGRWVAPPADR